MGMSLPQTPPSKNCYKVPNLSDPILETHNISYLQDRYSLGDQLGWGQFGTIRACSDLVSGETLACKSIAKDRLVSADNVRGVKLEVETMAKLSGHPNVVDLKAVYEDEGFVHLVMELCAGGELFHKIEKHGRFKEADAASLFGDLMGVVVYCHESGIVHRDLKPENVLLANKSNSSPIKLADYGLATYIKPGQSLYGTVGSPFYIAPEVLAGGYNEAADVWSAGVILYILLSGMPPFWGKTKSKIFEAVRSAELQFPSDPWDGISTFAQELVRGMLCRDPAQRLTAKQVLEHPWIKDFSHQPQRSYEQGSVTNFGQEENPGSCSFSTLHVSTSRDVSFGFASPISHHNQLDPSSPTYTCRSSFSTFYDDSTPSPTYTCRSSFSTFYDDSTPSPTLGFSFHNSSELNNTGLSPSPPLIPSFSFFSPPPTDEREIRLASQTESSMADTIQRDSSITELFAPEDSGHEIIEREQKAVGLRRAANSRTSINIRSKRNHTISLGEQLDLIVTESVIRWASCTDLSGALSLRSSLVC